MLATWAAFTLSGCSSSDDAEGGSDNAPRACPLLTRTEVESTLGVRVERGVETAMAHSGVCSYAASDGSDGSARNPVVQVTFTQGPEGRSRFEASEQGLGSPPGQPVDGIGDGAVLLGGAMTTLSVRSGDDNITVSFAGAGSEDPETVDALVRAAERALAQASRE